MNTRVDVDGVRTWVAEQIKHHEELADQLRSIHRLLFQEDGDRAAPEAQPTTPITKRNARHDRLH
jgi:hypothetical protein